jgi:uncharacterized membrane protein YheB (UPF0754 family)
MQAFRKVDLEALLGDVLAKGLKPKVDELRKMPLVGAFLTDERIDDLRAAIARGIMKHKELVFERLERAVEDGLDVQQLVRDKVAAFPVEKLESLVLEVAARELRAIEWLGGLLGLLIGVLQVLVLAAL